MNGRIMKLIYIVIVVCITFVGINFAVVEWFSNQQQRKLQISELMQKISESKLKIANLEQKLERQKNIRNFSIIAHIVGPLLPGIT